MLPKHELKISQLKLAIEKKQVIYVSKLINDTSWDNSFFETSEIKLLPVKIILHRNNLYLGAYNFNVKEIVFYAIQQLLTITFSNEKIVADGYLKLFEREIKNRFSITKNINNEIYAITLEIAPVLIDFIKQHNWHYTQKITKIKNRYYLSLTCGINRELIGWLYQWMYNVKNIEPEIFKDYYKKALVKTEEVNKKENRLVYKNIFESK